MILDHDLISDRYFFPRTGDVPQPFWVESEGHRLACYRIERYPDAKTLLHFHGNGEIVADYLPDFSEALLGLGVNVCFAEYRGYGASTGTPSLVAMLADVKAIVDTLSLPPQKLVAFGRSIGSIYAIEMAARFPDIAGLILESGIADPLERVLLRVRPQELGCSDEELQRAAAASLDHQAKLSGFTNPLLVMHTQHDGLVDLDHAQRNHAWAASAQKTLKIFPRGDHNSIMFHNWKEYMESLREFLKTLD